jgi:hypothetical protein
LKHSDPITCTNNATNPIPGSVFIGDWIKNRPDTGCWDWIDLQSDPNLFYKWDWVEQSNPGIGSSFNLIPNKYQSEDQLGYTLDYTKA